ncbi:MAG: type III pantothenate kinase [FCB group bacterium]|nr:type III pantothenate kinase [FCB group bacterium]
MGKLLCIDIGNTNVCAALMRDKQLAAEIRIPSHPLLQTEDYTSALQKLLQQSACAIEHLRAVVISSVVPQLTPAFIQACNMLFPGYPLIVDHTLPLNLKILYDDPSEVGADRICNAVGALERYTAPLIVVDMGTATTFDVISEQREYLGGVIMPGLETAGRDLFKRAARLPKVRFDFPEKIIGTNTRESLQAGLMWGTIDQIDGLIERICREWGKDKVSIIATGGLSAVIAAHSRYIRHVDKTLTLFGMACIYEQLSGGRL